VIPQVMPEIVAYWLYRFEINIRASAVLGIIGAGGIGDRLLALLRFREFAQVGTVLLMTIIVVMIVDAISSRIRARIIAGPDGSDDDDGNVLRRWMASRGSEGGTGIAGGM
jgi:phosphonate transport system permease protein